MAKASAVMQSARRGKWWEENQRLTSSARVIAPLTRRPVVVRPSSTR